MINDVLGIIKLQHNCRYCFCYPNIPIILLLLFLLIIIIINHLAIISSSVSFGSFCILVCTTSSFLIFNIGSTSNHFPEQGKMWASLQRQLGRVLVWLVLGLEMDTWSCVISHCVRTVFCWTEGAHLPHFGKVTFLTLNGNVNTVAELVFQKSPCSTTDFESDVQWLWQWVCIKSYDPCSFKNNKSLSWPSVLFWHHYLENYKKKKQIQLL